MKTSTINRIRAVGGALSARTTTNVTYEAGRCTIVVVTPFGACMVTRGPSDRAYRIAFEDKHDIKRMSGCSERGGAKGVTVGYEVHEKDMLATVRFGLTYFKHVQEAKT